jgi:hypothetical protein
MIRWAGNSQGVPVNVLVVTACTQEIEEPPPDHGPPPLEINVPWSVATFVVGIVLVAHAFRRMWRDRGLDERDP